MRLLQEGNARPYYHPHDQDSHNTMVELAGGKNDCVPPPNKDNFGATDRSK